MKKLVLGIVISAIFIYFSFRGVEFDKALRGLENINFILLQFCNFQLSPIVAFVVLISTVIGISLPTAPGMVGNFHFATIVALSLFGISKSEALSFSILFHFTAIGKHILLGLIFLPLVQISFKDITKRYGLANKST